MGKASSRSDGKTRADRKFEKKLQFYQQVRSSVASKDISKEKQQKKRRRQRKLKAYDLTSLSEFLPELKAPKEPRTAEFKLNCKSRNNLVLKESRQFNAVINNQNFQSNPLAAIYQHLQSTQPVMDEKHKKKDGKSRKRTKTKKKPNDLELMES